MGYPTGMNEAEPKEVDFIRQRRIGMIAIAAAISPYRSAREQVRSRIPNFVEIYLRCPLEVLVQRDVKGLYKRALAGEILHFSGISDPYEPPVAPELIIDSSKETPAESVARIWALLEGLKLVSYSHTSSAP